MKRLRVHVAVSDLDASRPKHEQKSAACCAPGCCAPEAA
jgi:hypothetical protein